ncbi:MAG: hypothetical protein K0R50_3698 [Eubacterium sp.]|jgi:hypothetical protein|nr:hypothetical protein [Eubacterium sp.]
MNYKLIEKNNKRYIEILSSQSPLNSEQDALDLIALCWELDTHQLMLHGEVLSGDFSNLRTGIAGGMLQKFINYSIRVAAIIPTEVANAGRFREMVLETNKGNAFRVFDKKEEAESWLLK